MDFKKQILEKVKRISGNYSGGEKFFDKLDEELVNESSVDLLTHLLSYVSNKKIAILSGKFGYMIADKINKGLLPHIPYILFKGGIRSGNSPEIIRKTSFYSKRAIFIDDSIYGGATYQTIKKFIKKESNIIIEKCVVIYDGCPIIKPDIKSIFRYYDYFESKPSFKF